MGTGVECGGGGGGAGECGACGVCECGKGAGLAVPDDDRDESTVDVDDERSISVGRFCTSVIRFR